MSPFSIWLHFSSASLSSPSHNPFIVFCRDIRIHTHTYIRTHTCAPDPATTSMEARQPGDRRGNEFPNEAPLSAPSLAPRAYSFLSRPFFHSIRTKSHLDPDIKENSASSREEG